MVPFRDALQKAIEPSKPLFEFVRMLLSYYALCGVLLLVLGHWKGILSDLSPVSRLSVYLGTAGIAVLVLVALFSLGLTITRFVMELKIGHPNLLVAVTKFFAIMVLLALLIATLPLLLNLAIELVISNSAKPSP